ncbi:MAG: ABC transporter substrate-binding protein [Aquihabitans sp.]
MSACSTDTSNSSSGGKTAGDTPSKPIKGGTLTIGVNAETDGWNPTNSQWSGAAYQIAQTFYDPLMAYGADRKPHPNLAKSVEPNDDYTVWTITLRPDITFHDGTSLDAPAVKLQLDKDVASFTVGQAFKSVESVEVKDRLTVEVKMNQPWVAFPAQLAGQGGFVAAPKQLNAEGAAATDRPIGTGPYVFKEWVRDDHLTVTRNPNYWRKDAAYPDTITFRPIPDDQTRLASVQSGDLDLTNTTVASGILSARKDSSLEIKEYDSDSLTMMMMNMAKAPVDDVRVREALALAIDQSELTKIVGRGLSQPATSPYTKDSQWFAESGYPTEPDVAKATSLLDAYKKDKGISGKLAFKVGCTPTPTNKQAMDIVKNQWSRVGVAIDLEYTEQATYINNALNGDYVVNCWTQLGGTDPDGDAIWWKSENANPPGQLALNFMRMKDPEVDAALLEGHSNPDPAVRRAAYAKVWKRFATVFPYAYLSHPHGSVLWTKGRVHGVGDAILPDGTPAQMYQGAVPAVIPLASVWVTP